MKNSKRFLSLALAMIMAFALLAVPAMAYDEGHEHECTVCSAEGITPRQKMVKCPSCSGFAYYYEIGGTGNRQVRIECTDPACGYDTGWVTP